MPLMVTGGFRTREGMQKALESGICQVVGIGRPMCADPHCMKKLFSGEIDSLPSFEKTLSLGPWIFSPNSPFTLIQAINAFGACLLYTSPSPRDVEESRMPSSA